MSGILLKIREMSVKKSCQGKLTNSFIADMTISAGADRGFCRKFEIQPELIGSASTTLHTDLASWLTHWLLTAPSVWLTWTVYMLA